MSWGTEAPQTAPFSVLADRGVATSEHEVLRLLTERARAHARRVA